MATTPTKKIIITTYFEILIGLHIFYFLNTCVKFRVN